MTLYDLIKSIRGDYSILITKKDGTFSDENAIVHHRDEFAKYSAEHNKAINIAMRKDLVLDAIIYDDGKDLLISLQEV